MSTQFDCRIVDFWFICCNKQIETIGGAALSQLVSNPRRCSCDDCKWARFGCHGSSSVSGCNAHSIETAEHWSRSVTPQATWNAKCNRGKGGKSLQKRKKK